VHDSSSVDYNGKTIPIIEALSKACSASRSDCHQVATFAISSECIASPCISAHLANRSYHVWQVGEARSQRLDAIYGPIGP
jgi:hypothetical protein